MSAGHVNDGRIEVRGLIAMNGNGELCFFAHARAEGVRLFDDQGRQLSITDAILTAPARRVTHAEIRTLDPVQLGGMGTSWEAPYDGYEV